MGTLKFSWRAGRIFLLLATGVLVTACAPPPPEVVKKRYLWPPVADAAKIEYLGFYAGENDLKRGSESWFETYVLGKESAQPVFKKPFAIDARFGKVIVTDTTARQVVLFDLARKSIAPLEIADARTGGAGMGLVTPTGVAFAGPDEIWLADSLAREVRRYGVDGRSLGKVGGDELTRPTALAIDHARRRVVVVDTPMHRLAVFDLDGVFHNYIGERGIGPGQFNYPVDAGFDADGDLYVLDALNSRVQRFRWEDNAYRYQMHFGERGTSEGSFQIPKSLAVTPSGHVYVTDSLGDKVIVFDRDGTFLLTFGGRFVAASGKFAPGGFNMPAGIAADENDGIWVVDSFNAMVHRFQYLNESYLRDHPVLPGQVAETALNVLFEKNDATVVPEKKP